MRKAIALLLITFTFSSCQRGCSKLKRTFVSSEKNYKIYVYSGGKIVFKDNFRGIMNNSTDSDGVYYFKNGKLIEISGDYIVESY